MKQTLTIALLIFCTTVWTSTVQANRLPLAKDLTIDAKKAKEKQAPILVLFMEKTCPYCETVLRDFLLPMQRDSTYSNKVVMRQIEINSKDQLIDFEGNTTTQAAFSRKNKVWGVPVVILFDSQGQVLTTITGLLNVDFYRAYLDNAINDSQEKIKAIAK